jgi:hypothetical protein
MVKKRRIAGAAGKRHATMTLGRERFAKISAVEGIVMTRQMTERLAAFDKQGLSPEERRTSIIRAHRKV